VANFYNLKAGTYSGCRQASVTERTCQEAMIPRQCNLHIKQLKKPSC
jgi:hypothetical protein